MSDYDDELFEAILNDRWEVVGSLLSPPSAFKVTREHVMDAVTRRGIPPDILSHMLTRCNMDELFPSATSNSGSRRAEGMTPLHNASTIGTVSTVRVILSALGRNAGEEVYRLTYGNQTALDSAWIYFFCSRGKKPEESWQELQHITCIDDMLRGQRFADLRELWNKTTFHMLAADRGELDHPLSDGRQWQIVHVIAANASGRGYFDTNALQMFCPTIVMWTALQLYPHQVRQRDERGRLPLHIAAANPVHHVLFSDKDTDNRSEFSWQTNQHVAQMLVERYPCGAKIADRGGRLPLNLAIESYDRWFTVTRIREIDASKEGAFPWQQRSNLDWNDAITSIMKAAPDALITRDTKTHLYPFMLAATVRSVPLDVVFKLLRANPSVVKGGIRRTLNEQYLEVKVEGLKRERETHLTELNALKAKVARLEGSPADVSKAKAKA